MLELLAFIDEVVDEVGSRKEIDYIHTTLDKGTSADRQLETYNQTKDFKQVVDRVLQESMEGI